MSKAFKTFYVIASLAIIFGYGAAVLNGFEFRRAKKEFVPSGIRGKQGGSAAVWYRGYHGGK
jgi:hypothetical protein